MGRKPKRQYAGSGKAGDHSVHPRTIHARTAVNDDPGKQRHSANHPGSVYAAAAVAGPAGTLLTLAAGFLILRVGRTSADIPGGISGAAASGAAVLILAAAVLFGAVSGGLFKILALEPDPSPERAALVAGFSSVGGAVLCTLISSVSGLVDPTPGLGFVALFYAMLVGLLCAQGAYVGVRRLF